MRRRWRRLAVHRSRDLDRHLVWPLVRVGLDALDRADPGDGTSGDLAGLLCHLCERTAAGDAFDALTSSGAPEYQVSVRTVDAAGKQSEWMPVGGLAVPRSNSVDKAVTMAIFQNEDERTPPAR